MVEGPGCKVKGEIMKKRVKGKVIRDLALHSSSNQKVVKETNSCQPHELLGLKVTDVRTLGKELFIFLEEFPVCIRIHFLMNGSVRYGEIIGKRQKASAPCLTVSFGNEKLTVFESSVDFRPSKECSDHCDNLADLDICSSSFDFKRAQLNIEAKSEDLICDVIMDQTVLPGVGNIIKNEGLFNSGIKPTSQVKALSSSLLTCLLHRLRDFSAIFYDCRKNNKPLKSYFKIYEKSMCTQCKHQVTVCKPGILKRLTFYCDVCQANSSSSKTLFLPKKNSLLGFLQLSAESETCHEWECSRCTFINRSPSVNCSICFAPSNDSRKRGASEDKHSSTHSVKRSKPMGLSDVCTTSSVEVSQNSDTHQDKVALTPPTCHKHEKPCSLKTVTRQGENKGRIFYCCRVGGKDQCNFFKWADLHHPLCQHSRRTVVRRVLKQNDNNGKEFFCCSLPKNNQCGFFKWVQS